METSPTVSNWQAKLAENGFALIREVYSADEIRDTITQLDAALAQASAESASIRSRGGRVYAARNLLELFPPAKEIWRRGPLVEVLRETLGRSCGLVRGLFFDKPPEQSWSLPWHRDLTIAVHDNSLPSSQFSNPTHKAGVPHVEAPQAVLEAMLTLRIHLDRTTAENGALQVLPGSHRCEDSSPTAEQTPTPILAEAGDVLAMHPLLSHSSGNSQPGTALHRRVIHLEFAADRELPDGFVWHYFEPL